MRGKLKIVTIVDFFDDGISAVYTFFDTNNKRKSYGTYSIIWLLQHCKNEKLKYLYLGYWIDECSKMKYKTNFMPYELLINNSLARSKLMMHMIQFTKNNKYSTNEKITKFLELAL